jgi:TonB family protein
MYKHRVLALTLAVFCASARVRAQAHDSIYAGRLCDNRLKALRMPVLAELGDSARIDSLLSAAADSDAHITSVEIRYRKDGALQGLDVNGIRSESARHRLRDSLSPVIKLQRLPVGPFNLDVVRLNGTQQIRLMAGSATCEPRPHTTAELDSRIEFIRQTAPEARIHRDVPVEFILEANGVVSDAWLSRPTGFSRVDSLTMQLFRTMSFYPAIVGRTPVASLVVQPFKF